MLFLVWSGEKRGRNFKKMSKNQREPSSSFSSRSSLRRSSSFGSPIISSAVRFLSRKERASFSLSLSPLLLSAKTQRERERMRSHSRGDFRHPNFQNVFIEKMMMTDTLTSSRRKKERERSKREQRERNARARRVKRICSFARRRKESRGLLSLLFVPFL